ncbi:hypothetical protein KKD19_06645 [Patescibacteria group bacterium]|nr:hypothetical protein [Patescibacteria group bacterium]MBU4512881.1 hypothetical protein [Patescibacteria group bacterium]MCG2693159.1 hypothetical protein [Candidatus Parcubacteria bacterium]
MLSKNKKLRAEKREEKKEKLKNKQVSLADQIKKVKTNRNYRGDVKKFI